MKWNVLFAVTFAIFNNNVTCYRPGPLHHAHHDGKEWPHRHDAHEWPHKHDGNEWFHTYDHHEWPQKHDDHEWPHKRDGNEWIHKHGRHEWPQKHDGHEWPHKRDGSEWPQTHNGNEGPHQWPQSSESNEDSSESSSSSSSNESVDMHSKESKEPEDNSFKPTWPESPGPINPSPIPSLNTKGTAPNTVRPTVTQPITTKPTISESPRQQSQIVRDCIRSCPVTSEFNPVCGTDNVTYRNPGGLSCAQFCGVNVSIARRLPCPDLNKIQKN